MLMYVVESKWSWDNSHTEYATMSIEEFEAIEDLEDPKCSEEYKQFIFQRLRSIAEIQNGCPVVGPYPTETTIYRAVDFKTTSQVVESKLVTFELRPVFRFDKKWNPIPIV